MAAVGNHQFLVSVGSVGQPRDGDWRSAYTLWDTDEQWVELQRVEYPVKLTQQKIDNLGYPKGDLHYTQWEMSSRKALLPLNCNRNCLQ